jgi:hypothetical protein
MSIASKTGIDPRKLAEAHWEYVDGVLAAHGVDHSTRVACQYHYETAFIHGWKHCEEAADAAGLLNYVGMDRAE